MDISCFCPSALLPPLQNIRRLTGGQRAFGQFNRTAGGIGGRSGRGATNRRNVRFPNMCLRRRKERERERVRVSDRLMILDMGKLDNFRGKVGRCNPFPLNTRKISNIRTIPNRARSAMPFSSRGRCLFSLHPSHSFVHG